MLAVQQTPPPLSSSSLPHNRRPQQSIAQVLIKQAIKLIPKPTPPHHAIPSSRTHARTHPAPRTHPPTRNFPP
ncbi:hypothetical protein K505DRAFT_321057 [Melanomma pulvis-pyrius CBS 109.77]|uniref:Uncharacterized protein n=1 Tax=Melanomma pulvis-pyrius CBS 109.77 TaxID=1314802 RepID=A0A6A6XT37_9PLEO|nr:hypothetical protein K505DRAFT_321057 [Melanomma pulvis-pyrius CBS 109.77]